MMTQDDFAAAFRSEVGDAAALVRDPEIFRWFNAGQRALGTYREKNAGLTWALGATEVDLPTDFVRPELLDGDDVPSYRIWGDPKKIIFREATYSAGTGTLYYYAAWPRVTGSQPSLLPDVGDDACLSYALYRFFKRVASSRSDYRKFATTVAANGVDISELDALSERHYNDFLASRDELQDRDDTAIGFFD